MPETIKSSKRRDSLRNWDALAEDYLFLKSHGVHFDEIAKRFGIKPKTLETYCRRLNLPVRDAREVS